MIYCALSRHLNSGYSTFNFKSKAVEAGMYFSQTETQIK